MQALDVRDFEIERRLDAFARARLTPDPQFVARARGRVMREARLQFEAARIAAHVVPAVTLAARRSTPRRLAMPLLAASVWLGIAAGSVAASQAGGPLYPARLWIETATLPANIADRIAAEIARLDARLGDAMTAASHGDSWAVAAALEAYRQIADETVASSSGDAGLEDLVAAALGRHVGVLSAVSQSLDAKGETSAAKAVELAIQRAIEHNAAVVEGFAGTGNDRPSGAASGPADGTSGSGGAKSDTGGSGTTGGTGGTGTGGTGATGGGPSGDPTGGGEKPTKEPKPTPDQPDQPDQPDRTPHAKGG